MRAKRLENQKTMDEIGKNSVKCGGYYGNVR